MTRNTFSEIPLRIELTEESDTSTPNKIKLMKKESSNTAHCGKNCGCKVMEKALIYNKFEANYGEIVTITFPHDNVDNAIVVGLGKEINNQQAEQLGGKIFKIISSMKNAVEFSLIGDIEDNIKLHIAHGIALAAWKFDKYISKKSVTTNQAIVVHVEHVNSAREYQKELDILLKGVNLAKTLISEPANVLYPATFVEFFKKLQPLGVKISVLEKADIVKNNMNALMAVAQGSDNEPKVLILEWHGDAKNSDKILAFVGKGVTFDSGGINLKSSAALKDMKTDMSGAATVAAMVQILAERKAKINVVAVCGLVENMPSGKAQKVGDIVKSMSGTTIEVIDTDAEGRMVLADCLTYVQEKFSPHTIIDLATLTGAVLGALGQEYAGLFSNDDALAKQLTQSGIATNELLWQLPLCKKFGEAIHSNVADIMNLAKPGTGAGSSTAAHFLKCFIKDGTKWAHLDVAGTVYTDSDEGLHRKGATGFGIKLLNHFVCNNLE